MTAQFYIQKSKDGQFFFHLRAANNEVILASETYTEKAKAEQGIASVKRHAPDEANYEKRKTGAGYSFVLSAANGEIIGRSEVYTRASSRDDGIEAVRMTALLAEIVDET
jgi:uncharacterized protein YegP (UPF0339 family)